MYKILIVENDATVSSIICENLNKWGFAAFETSDFKDILSIYGEVKPHLVLMDINLPFYDGFYWCERIRKLSNVPILFVSSRSDNSDKIRAISGGGDDYIEKPFSMDLLIAKVQAALRRAYSYTDNSSNLLFHSGLILDLEKSVVSIEDQEVSLTHNECRILGLLIKACGKIVSRTKIMKTLWQDENFIDENTLTVNINRLRSKLKQINSDDIIETIKGKGYKLL